MSFNNINQDLESNAADARSVHYKDYPEFETSTQQIESTLYNINNVQLSTIKNFIGQYETALKDDDANTVKLNKLSTTITSNIDRVTKNYKMINDLAQNINQYLNDCETNNEDTDTINYLKQKESLVVKLIKSSLRQFQSLQKKFEALQHKTITKYGKLQESDQELVSSQHQQFDEQSGALSQQQIHREQTQDLVQISYEPVNAEELEQQTLLIQEREREIEQIGQDISYINEIYGNLEEIVHEQQFTIDSIEDNVLRYSADTQGASNELRRAERYQRRSNGRMLCCFFILFGLLAFIILLQLIF